MLTCMCANGKLVISYKSISWLLIAAILLLAFLPAHYHLHHHYKDDAFSSAARHAHVIDLHVLTEKMGQSHHHDDEATIIAASPDGIVKKSNPELSPFILLIIVLQLLPVLCKQINIQLNYRSTDLKLPYPHFTPPSALWMSSTRQRSRSGSRDKVGCSILYGKTKASSTP